LNIKSAILAHTGKNWFSS